MKKILCLLLVLCLMPVFSSVAKAEENTKLPVSFVAPGSIVDVMQYEVAFDPTWFFTENTQYQHNLARASLGMALSAFRENALGLANCGDPITAFLSAAGFNNIELISYNQPTSEHTIGTAMGTMTLDNGDTLVAVAVSGGGYEMEWLSNFDIGTQSAHMGFDEAAHTVVERVKTYIAEMKGNVKIWTSGYSRGAAVSNRTATLLLDEGIVAEGNLYGYMFATPNNVLASSLTRQYPQIFNIVGQFDPVPTVPLTEWGYGKAGVVKRINAQETDSNYLAGLGAMQDMYETLTGGNMYENNPSVNWLVRKVLLIFYNACANTTVYTENYQDLLRETFAAEGGIMSKVQSALTKVFSIPEIVTELKKEGRVLWSMASQKLYGEFMALTGSQETTTWGSIAGIAQSLVQEHYPQVYVSWMMTNDESIFTQNVGYRQLAVNGSGILTWNSDNGYMGTLATGVESKEGVVCATMLGDITMFTIPADCSFSMTYVADKEQQAMVQVTARKAGLLTHETKNYEQIEMMRGESISFDFPAGLENAVEVKLIGVALSPLEDEGETAMEKQMETASITDGVSSNFLTGLFVGMGGVTLLFAVCILTVHFVRNAKRKKKKKAAASGQTA